MSRASREHASLTISNHLLTSPEYHTAQIIGTYLAFADEVDLAHFIERAHRDQKTIYVPRIAADAPQMQFARLNQDTKLKRNRFGINEPVSHESEYVDPRALQMVLTPLVAFDDAGNRLGMGAGYYDRSFGFRRESPSTRHPRLIGVAFSCQQVTAIERECWDVPLDCIATEAGMKLTQVTNENI